MTTTHNTRTGGEAETAIGGEAPAPQTHVVPQDVITLVVAAREALSYFYGIDGEELQALDRATEAFADRVPFDDEPDATEGSADA